ncbi:MAG: ATP-binding protein [Balneola sp.]
MSIKRLLPNFNKNQKLEYRLFEITLVLTISVFIFWCILAVILDYTLTIKIVYFIALSLYSGIYIAYKLGTSFKVATAIYYGMALFILIYSWLPAGGISGAIIQMFILIFASGLMVLPLRAYITFISASLAIVIIYAIAEINIPGLAVPYASEVDRVRDLSIANIITLCILGFGLYIFKRAYSEDRYKLKVINQELEIEKENAQSADKAKSDFLATISHEMRTPLNGIVGISQLLKETKLSEDQEQLISNLTYSSELLHGLISDILDISLIENGKLVIQSSEIEVKKEISKLIEIVKPRLDQKENKIELIVKHDDKIPEILIGDALRFRQVILNLLNNSIKFTDEGVVEVSSELLFSTEKSVRVKFTINDTGRGISKEGQDKLFSKFYKGSGDSNIEGTGLGLSISKNLINLMGGEIGFQSQQGVGSAFYFELPFEPLSVNPNKPVDQELKEKPLTDIRILIAEDVRINQIVIQKMLESYGLTSIEIANNGEEAVKKIKEKWYDVILMDIQMPVMDGLEASRLISHQFIKQKKPVIIAITANAMITDQEKYEAAGIDGFLSKPITKEALKETLGKFI